VVISLKRFLDKGSDDRVDTLERVVQLLLRAVALHSIQGAPEDYAAFQAGIQQVFDSIKTVRDPKDYLVLGGAAIRSVEDYQRRTVRYLSRLRAEMQRMIGMLTASISSISEASNENLRRLRNIENQVEQAAELDDVRQVKARLCECLEDIRLERERQKARTSRTVADLNGTLESVRSEIGRAGANSETASPETDSVTGLPDRRAAESAIERECLLQRSSQAVVIGLDNLSAVSLRYGRAIGDEVLRSFGDHLVQLLSPEEELFHWDGPALLVLSRRPERPDRIRERFGRILEKKFEHSIQTSSRDTVLTVMTRWAVLPVGAEAEAMFRKIELFLAPSEVTTSGRG
jgi:GGDEF domain-containing protein